MDFTLETYRNLIICLQANSYTIQNFQQFLQQPEQKVAILRHDIDKLPANALKMAAIEHELAVSASYFFRVVPSVWDKAVMEKIVNLGHELGYHYEDLVLAKGDTENAIRHFEKQLAIFRQIYPVKTICMHGSPLSRYDNRELWKNYNYRDYGIIGEPYFDVDCKMVFYITDTGRKWNNAAASIRDRVASGFDIPIRSTAHLADLAGKGALPDQVMINAHPQRWFDFGMGWIKELVGQNAKNIVKSALIKFKSQQTSGN